MLKLLKGCGDVTLAALHEANIQSLKDLVHTYPKRYQTVTLLSPSLSSAQKGLFAARVLTKAKAFQVRRGLTRVTVLVRVGDSEHTLQFFNQTHWLKHLHPGIEIVFEGTHDPTQKRLNIQRIMLKKNLEEGIHPLYRVEGVSEGRMKDLIQQAMYIGGQHPEDPLPGELIQKRSLIPYDAFIRAVHAPKNEAVLEAVWKRLSYEALLQKQLLALFSKQTFEKPKARSRLLSFSVLEPFIQRLPYTLTEGQTHLIKECIQTLNEPKTLYRMIQGDTGSGKTIVALLLAYGALLRGEQVALLAPTEALAWQHAQVATSYFEPLGYEVSVLLGSQSTKEKQALKQTIAAKVHLVIGTHALFSDDVCYHHLGLVIIDEQHRFGVNQRIKMTQKGSLVDVLYLSATPIPRTLAMTLYGDMAISTLRDKPKDRQPITTQLYALKKAKELDETILATLRRDEQVFIIAPRIEDDESLLSVERIESYYRNRFPDRRLARLHGRLKSEEKETILKDFKAHRTELLIATSVIEVGIDIPQASLMLIYHAERFGLAQLHQLRGRLARGTLAGTCYCLYRGNSEVRQRLSILETTNDGFVLSEKDLEQRGFGDVLGVEQSGVIPYRYDNELDLFAQLQAVKEDALELLNDPASAQEALHHLLQLH